MLPVRWFQNRPLNIEVFLDGRYFNIVSNYYRHEHPVAKHIHPKGLMYFLRHKLRKALRTDINLITIGNIRMFMGVNGSPDQHELNDLHEKRTGLSIKGVHLYTFPLKKFQDGTMKEEGVDVALALSAYRSASENALDVAVLMTGDGDYVPLVRELHRMQKLVVLLYQNLTASEKEESRNATTSLSLLRETDLPFDIGYNIEKGLKSKNLFVEGIFDISKVAEIEEENSVHDPKEAVLDNPRPIESSTQKGRVITKSAIHGYISPLNSRQPKLLFFKDSGSNSQDFEGLVVGSDVDFEISEKRYGKRRLAINVRKVTS